MIYLKIKINFWRLSAAKTDQPLIWTCVRWGGSDFCFVSHAASDPALHGHRARIPFVRKVLRQKNRDDSILVHQHHERMSNPQLPKMGVLVTGSGAAGECGLKDLGFEVTAFCEPDRM